MTKLEWRMTNGREEMSGLLIRHSSFVISYFIFMLIKNSAFVFVFIS